MRKGGEQAAGDMKFLECKMVRMTRAMDRIGQRACGRFPTGIAGAHVVAGQACHPHSCIGCSHGTPGNIMVVPHDGHASIHWTGGLEVEASE